MVKVIRTTPTGHTPLFPPPVLVDRAKVACPKMTVTSMDSMSQMTHFLPPVEAERAKTPSPIIEVTQIAPTGHTPRFQPHVLVERAKTAFPGMTLTPMDPMSSTTHFPWQVGAERAKTAHPMVKVDEEGGDVLHAPFPISSVGGSGDGGFSKYNSDADGIYASGDAFSTAGGGGASEDGTVVGGR